MSWVDDIHGTVPGVAAALGLEGSMRRGFPCPACHAARRGEGERRLPVSCPRGGGGWVCRAPGCGATGGWLDYLSWHLVGGAYKDVSPEQARSVRAWCEERYGTTAPQVPAGAATQASALYPPGVAEFWGRCRSVLKSQTTLAWMKTRGFGTRLEQVASADLARLTPTGEEGYPDWWPAGRRIHWRLVVRAYDVRGELRSIHGRACCSGHPQINGRNGPRQVWPKHPDEDQRFDCAGLFFACPRALALLRGEEVTARALLLVEGLTDFLAAAAWATERVELGRAPVAVLGGVSGSWPALSDLRDRLPWNLPVVSALDGDGDGDRYHARAAEALERSIPRLYLGRIDGEGKRLDVDDTLRLGGDLAALISSAVKGESRPGVRDELLWWWGENPDATSEEVGRVFGVSGNQARAWRSKQGRNAAEPVAPPGRNAAEPVAPPGRNAAEPVAPPGRNAPEPVAPPGRNAPEPVAPPGRNAPEPVAPPGRNAPEPVAPPGRNAPEPVAPPGRNDRSTSNDPGGATALATFTRVLEEMQAVAGERGSKGRVRELAEQLLAPETLGSLALAQRSQPHDVQRLLFRLGGIRGLGAGFSRDLTRAIAQASAPAGSDGPSPGAHGDGRPGLLAALGPLAEGLVAPAGLVVPYPWEVTSGGVYWLEPSESGLERHRVLARPLLVVGVAEGEDGGQTSYTLAWWSGVCWVRREVPVRQALHRQRIVDVDGLEVSTESGRNVVRFIEAFVAENRARLEVRTQTWRLGWRAEGFLLGNQLIGPDGPLPPPAIDPERADFVAAYAPKGTYEGWRATIERLKPYPRAMLALYVGLVPPLLKLVEGAPNHVVDWAGMTSAGKTLVLMVAASHYGNPSDKDGIVGSWAEKAVFIERRAGAVCDLPLILDDTVKCEDKRKIQPLIFAVHQGRSIGRGTVTWVQKQTSWRTVLMSTGEAPCTSFTTQGGAEMRSLVVWGQPLGDHSVAGAQFARDLAVQLLRHHGHSGPRWVQLLQRPGMVAEANRLYAEGRAFWDARCVETPMLARLADYGALVHVAYQLGTRHLGLPECPEIFDVIGTAAERQAGAADKAAMALDDVFGWASARRAHFYSAHQQGQHPARPPTDGWLGAWEQSDMWKTIGFLRAPLARYLDEQGYDAAAIFQTWAQRGWLVCSEAGRIDGRFRVGTGKWSSAPRGIVVRREAIGAQAEPDPDAAQPEPAPF